MGKSMPDPRIIAPQCEVRERRYKREKILKLVEAQIIGNVELSPDEMVETAFEILAKVDSKLYGEPAPAEIQKR